MLWSTLSLCVPELEWNKELMVDKQVHEDKVVMTTKVSGEVLVNRNMLLRSFMDEKKWADLFTPMVKNCSFDGKMKVQQDTGEMVMVMTVKKTLRSLSPAIPPKEFKATRLLKNTVDGEALVVDVEEAEKVLVSGCRVKSLSDAKSEVTFLVQRSYTLGTVGEDYEKLLEMAFNAGRWLATLKRECERRAIHGFIFSPLVDDGGENNERHRKILRAGKQMTEKFLSLITVGPYEAGVVHYRDDVSSNLFSAYFSVKMNAPHVRVFQVCKEFIFSEHDADGVQRQIARGNNNCVCRLLVLGQKKTLIDAYIDASESLLVYVQKPAPLYNLAGFTIENDGDGSSYLTFAVLASLVTDVTTEAIESWKKQVAEKIHLVVDNIIAAAVP